MGGVSGLGVVFFEDKESGEGVYFKNILGWLDVIEFWRVVSKKS